MKTIIENRDQVVNLLTDEFIASYIKVAGCEGLNTLDELIDEVFETCIANDGNEDDAISLLNIQHDNYQDEIPSLI